MSDISVAFTFSLVVATVITYLLGVAVWWRMIVQRRRRAHERSSNFVGALLLAQNNEAIVALNDVLDLYRANFDKAVLSYRDRQHISQLIRNALSRLASTEGLAAKAIPDKLALWRLLLAENEESLKNEALRLPFSDAPSPERQLLEDVLELTKADRDLIRDKLTQVAQAVAARESTIKRLGEESRQSLRYAKLGLAGTVGFSLLSIGLTIWSLSK